MSWNFPDLLEKELKLGGGGMFAGNLGSDEIARGGFADCPYILDPFKTKT